MPIDYEAIERAGGHGKLNRTLEDYKATRDALIKRLDEKGSKEAKDRAKGRCEIWIDGVRCTKADSQTHHMLSGRGVRARGESAKAHRKQRACHECHRRITGAIGAGKVQRLGAEMPHYTDRYRSVK